MAHYVVLCSFALYELYTVSIIEILEDFHAIYHFLNTLGRVYVLALKCAHARCTACRIGTGTGKP